MAKYILIERSDEFATLVRSEIETASENPLTEHEIIINELYRKLQNKTILDNKLICPNCMIELSLEMKELTNSDILKLMKI
jgi:hypothetical protein